MITRGLFGLNYVPAFERIGDKPWEKMDELIGLVGVSSLRVPGGVDAEVATDIFSPYAKTDLLGRDIQPLDALFDDAARLDVSLRFILPTRPFMPGQREDIGILEWQGEWVYDGEGMPDARIVVHDWVRALVFESARTGVVVEAIELGNEYEGVSWRTRDGESVAITARQYGMIASRQAEWIKEISDVPVLVQAWVDANDGGIGKDELKGRNEVVLSQFYGNASLIDGLSVHLYYKHNKTFGQDEHEVVHTLEGWSDRFSDIGEFTTAWREAGAGADLHFTEWNVQKRPLVDPDNGFEVSRGWVEHSFYGMKGLPVLTHFIHEFSLHNVTSAQLWGGFYNNAALAQLGGEALLTTSGQWIGLLQGRLLDMTADGISVRDNVVSAKFSGVSGSDLIISNMSSKGIRVDFSEVFLGGRLDRFFIEAGSSDALFTQDGKTFHLPEGFSAAEPDTRLSAASHFVQDAFIFLEPYETVWLSEHRVDGGLYVENDLVEFSNTGEGGSGNLEKVAGGASAHPGASVDDVLDSGDLMDVFWFM